MNVQLVARRVRTTVRVSAQKVQSPKKRLLPRVVKKKAALNAKRKPAMKRVVVQRAEMKARLYLLRRKQVCQNVKKAV